MNRNTRKKKNQWFLITIALVGLCMIPLVAAPQAEKYKSAPMNPEFVKYWDNYYKGNVRQFSQEGYPLGWIPAPTNQDIAKGQKIVLDKALAVLPTSYDLRTQGKLTSVKDQGNCGACWTFAAMGAMESQLLPGETWDFAENHMKNTHGFDPPCCLGGNTFMSSAYLTRWSGPMLEASDPYSDDENNCVSPGGLTVQKHLQDVIWIPARGGDLDNDNIKQAVMTYGGVNMGMKWYDTAYNAATNSYYYNGAGDEGGHAVLIVGWDDNYDKTNFGTQPPGNGAFIIKNSWNTTWGDSGFFYLSYYDTKAAKTSFQTVYPGIDTTSNFTNIYYYDPLGSCDNLGTGADDTAWFGNVFTSVAQEKLMAVAWFTMAPSSTYEIKVYLDPDSGPINTGGATATKTGTIANMGYETVYLNTPVDLSNGQKFSVVVKLTTPGNNYPIPMEKPVADFSSGATASAGQSYVSTDGTTYDDLTGLVANANVCLKAYTGTGVARPCGDANNDGKVTPGDAQWAYDCSIGAHSGGECDLTYIDVNDSGAITSDDADAIFDHWLKGTSLNCP